MLLVAMPFLFSHPPLHTFEGHRTSIVVCGLSLQKGGGQVLVAHAFAVTLVVISAGGLRVRSGLAAVVAEVQR